MVKKAIMLPTVLRQELVAALLRTAVETWQRLSRPEQPDTTDHSGWVLLLDARCMSAKQPTRWVTRNTTHHPDLSQYIRTMEDGLAMGLLHSIAFFKSALQHGRPHDVILAIHMLAPVCSREEGGEAVAYVCLLTLHGSDGSPHPVTLPVGCTVGRLFDVTVAETEGGASAATHQNVLLLVTVLSMVHTVLGLLVDEYTPVPRYAIDVSFPQPDVARLTSTAAAVLTPPCLHIRHGPCAVIHDPVRHQGLALQRACRVGRSVVWLHCPCCGHRRVQILQACPRCSTCAAAYIVDTGRVPTIEICMDSLPLMV